MGDYYQTIVDIEVTEGDAELLAQTVVKALVHKGIISPLLSACILDEKPGYPPGPSADEALNTPNAAVFRELAINGLDVQIGKVIGLPAEAWAGNYKVLCSRCGVERAARGEWDSALGEWHSRRGAGFLKCSACGVAYPVTEWRYEPPWGFGNLGFTFWNWPKLGLHFIQEFERLLGHRMVYTWGKI